MKNHLTADQLLLINHRVDFIRKCLKKRLKRLKRVDMELVGTTISEHIFNLGKAEDKTEGIIEGQLAVLENLYRRGFIRRTDEIHDRTSPAETERTDRKTKRDITYNALIR